MNEGVPATRIVGVGEVEVALRSKLAAAIPPWVTGSLSQLDIAFLLHCVMLHAPRHVVEIGTGSGVSTAVICEGLEAAAAMSGSLDGYTVVTYDVTSRLWFDNDRSVGEAASSLARPEALQHVTFRNPATALDAAREHGENSVPFAFIDASHSHPWPALDLLTLLNCLRAGGTVVLHDINLPLKNEEFQVWGVKWLYDEVDAVRFAGEGELPNIGAIMVPADKAALRRNLIRIIHSHPWEADVPDELLLELDVPRELS
jgi:predicted O-methyltransferase YrrM